MSRLNVPLMSKKEAIMEEFEENEDISEDLAESCEFVGGELTKNNDKVWCKLEMNGKDLFVGYDKETDVAGIGVDSLVERARMKNPKGIISIGKEHDSMTIVGKCGDLGFHETSDGFALTSAIKCED